MRWHADGNRLARRPALESLQWRGRLCFCFIYTGSGNDSDEPTVSGVCGRVDREMADG